MMSDPWHLQRLEFKALYPLTSSQGSFLKVEPKIFMYRNQMNHKTQRHFHGMLWRKKPRGFTHPSKIRLPEGAVSHTHGGRCLGCAVLTDASSLSPTPVTEEGRWGPCISQAGFAMPVAVWVWDLLILEEITGVWRFDFSLSPNEGRWLRVYWLPCFVDSHHKIWRAGLYYYSWNMRLTETQQPAQGIPKTSLAKICGYITHSLLLSHLKGPLNFWRHHLSPCCITSSLGLNWVESMWFHVERILGKKTVNQRSNCSSCERIASTLWPVS